MTDLPLSLCRVREQHPWEEVAFRARSSLGTRVPELRGYVEAVPQAVFGLGSGFFYLPAAQAAEWGVHDERWTASFLELLAVGHAHFAAQDLQIDEGACPPELTLLSDVALLEYIDGLRAHAPPEQLSRYTHLHDRYYRWYVQAMSIELRHRESLHPYSANEVLGLGMKAAPGNSVLHIVADRAGVQDAAALVRSVMQLCAGLQVVDDLNDLERDLRDGNYTMPLTSALLRSGTSPDEAVELEPGDLAVLSATVGATDRCLGIALSCFDLAAKSADSAKASVVEQLASMWRSRILERRAGIAAAMGSSSDG